MGVPHRNCVAYKSVSGHLALRDDVNKDCFFLGHNTFLVFKENIKFDIYKNYIYKIH